MCLSLGRKPLGRRLLCSLGQASCLKTGLHGNHVTAGVQRAGPAEPAALGLLNKAGRSVPQASCRLRRPPKRSEKARNLAWGVVAVVGRARLPVLGGTEGSVAAGSGHSGRGCIPCCLGEWEAPSGSFSCPPGLPLGRGRTVTSPRMCRVPPNLNELFLWGQCLGVLHNCPVISPSLSFPA